MPRQAGNRLHPQNVFPAFLPFRDISQHHAAAAFRTLGGGFLSQLRFFSKMANVLSVSGHPTL